MNHLLEEFQVGLANPDEYLNPYRWVNEQEGNVTPVLHARFQRAGEPLDAYAKLMDISKPEGQVECLNEISGWLVAKACGLPVAPSAFLACIRTNDLPAFQSGLTHGISAQGHHYFFCTEQISGAQARGVVATQELLEEQAQWEHAYAALAFDEWTGNTDRHLYNLVRTGKGCFSLIDHGRLAYRENHQPPHWEPHSLHDLRKTPFANLLHHNLFLCRNVNGPSAVVEAFHKCADSAQQQDNNMRRALHEIAFWCGTIAPGHSAEWLHFLHARASHAKALLANRFRVLNLS